MEKIVASEIKALSKGSKPTARAAENFVEVTGEVATLLTQALSILAVPKVWDSVPELESHNQLRKRVASVQAFASKLSRKHARLGLLRSVREHAKKHESKAAVIKTTTTPKRRTEKATIYYRRHASNTQQAKETTNDGGSTPATSTRSRSTIQQNSREQQDDPDSQQNGGIAD